MHFNSLLAKVDDIRFIAKPSNVSIIENSESKLDSSTLNSEVDIVGYDIIRMDRSRREGGVECYIKKSLSYYHKSSFSLNIENIFINIFLPKSKPILVGVLYRQLDKSSFIENQDNSLKESNIFNIQECYLRGDFNIKLLSGNKMLLVKQYYGSYTQAPSLVIKYMDLCFSHSLHQLIAEPTRTIEHTKTLIVYILTNPAEKVIQSGGIEMRLSDHGLIYFTRKMSLLKLNEHYEISIKSMKNYFDEISVEQLRAIKFLDYSNYTRLKDAYQDFLMKLLSVNDFVAPIRT